MEDIKKISTNRYLLKITIPVLVETVFGMLLGQVDALMVSNCTKHGFEAVCNAQQIVFFVLIFLRVLSTAATILISQYMGSKQTEILPTIYTVCVYVNIIISLVLSVALFVLCEPIYRALHCLPQLLPECVIYTKIVACGFIFDSLLNTYSAIFRTNGYMKEAMIVTVVFNIINVGGNAMLLYGFFGLPRLGVKGIAISTTVSKALGMILLYFFKHRYKLKTSLRLLFPFPFTLLKKLFVVGVPSIGENFAYDFAMIFVQRFVNMSGAVAVSAKATVYVVTMFTYCYSMALCTTTQIVVGYMAGAKEHKSIKKRFWSSIKIGCITTFALSLIVLIAGRYLCGFLTHDTAVISLCTKILIIDLFLEQGRSINLIAVRALQGCGDVRFPVYYGMCNEWAVAVGLGFLLGIVFNMGLVGIWLALASDEIMRGIVAIIRFKTGKWQSLQLV